MGRWGPDPFRWTLFSPPSHPQEILPPRKANPKLNPPPPPFWCVPSYPPNPSISVASPPQPSPPPPFKMPRHRRDSYAERRAEEKYYEYLYDECHCPFYETEDGQWEQDTSDPCYHCRWEAKRLRRLAEEAAAAAARLAANPWAPQITAIRALIDASQAAVGVDAKVAAVSKLFTELLQQHDFLSAQPKFREAVKKKIADFRGVPEAAPLVPEMDRLEALLAEVEAPAAPAE